MIAQGIEISKALDCAEKVFSSHLPGYTLGVGNTNSPFRNDKIPSLQVKWSYGKWRFRDFGSSEYKGDCIDFVKMLYSCSFNEAVEKIINDFSSNDPVRKLDSHCLKKINKKDSKPVELDIKKRLYTPDELKWWLEFGISKSTLDFYKVVPITHYFINKHPILCKQSTYAFEENKDGKKSYKLYCPEAINPKDKWLNNQDSSTLQGWEQLPATGDLLIVGKSRKDIMLLYELGYSAVGPASETSFIKAKILKQLQERFKKIIIFYDNDQPGRKESSKFSEKFNIPYVYIPLEYKEKDITDFRKKYGEELTKQLLNELIRTT